MPRGALFIIWRQTPRCFSTQIRRICVKRCCIVCPRDIAQFPGALQTKTLYTARLLFAAIRFGKLLLVGLTAWWCACFRKYNAPWTNRRRVGPTLGSIWKEPHQHLYIRTHRAPRAVLMHLGLPKTNCFRARDPGACFVTKLLLVTYYYIDWRVCARNLMSF